MQVTTQNSRLLAIDLARGLAVFFMIAVHTLEVFASPEVKSSLFGQIIEFLGGPPAAPVFMTLMGFSFMYSRNAELKPRLLRGFKLFLSGYVLNVLRGVLPFMLSTHLNMDIASTFPIEKLNAFTILTIVDILQFAGIALMIMALIQEFKINKYMILLAAFLISMFSPFLWGFRLNMQFVDPFLELFVGDLPIGFSFIENKIAFPLFPWLSFPLLGMFLGDMMKNAKDQNKAFQTFGLIGIIVLLIGVAISYSDFEYHFNDYYHSRQGAMIFMSGFVLFWIYLNKLLLDRVPMNRFFELLFKWSHGVTNIYFAQWIIIIWSIAFWGINKSSFTAVVVLILTFTLVSHFVNEFIQFSKRKTNAKQPKGELRG